METNSAEMKFTCFTVPCEGIRVEGAPEGSKEVVLEWMENTFGPLHKPDGSTMPAEELFYEGECETYERENGEWIFLAEILP